MKKKNKFYEVKNIHDHPFIQAIWCKELNGYIRKMSVLGSYMLENRRQKRVIDRLSRKIQKLRSGTFTISEINKMLFCFDIIAQEYEYDPQLAKIYEKLYAYGERMKNEKKGF